MSFATPLTDSVTISDIESETISEIEISSTLELKRHEFDYERGEMARKIIKCYHGKSTRRVTRKSEDELIHQKIEMEEEAKKAALMECFKECFGFTEFKDLVFDELRRPMNA